MRLLCKRGDERESLQVSGWGKLKLKESCLTVSKSRHGGNYGRHQAGLIFWEKGWGLIDCYPDILENIRNDCVLLMMSEIIFTSDYPSQHLFWASAAVAVKYQPSPWLLYKERRKWVEDLTPYSTEVLCSLITPLFFMLTCFLFSICCFFPFAWKNSSHICMYATLCTCCFKVYCMRLHFLKQWPRGDIALPGVDLHSGKTRWQLLATDIEKRKKTKTARILQRTDIHRPFFLLEQ